MSDDVNNKIKQIVDLLGQDNMQENLMNILGALSTSNEKSKEQEQPENKEAQQNRNVSSPEANNNLEMIRTVKRVMDHMQTNNDPRVNLLNSIKPFLGNRRQSKVNNCIMLLQLSGFTRLIDETDNSSNKENHRSDKL